MFLNFRERLKFNNKELNKVDRNKCYIKLKLGVEEGVVYCEKGYGRLV